jgi:hypothetical protein
MPRTRAAVSSCLASIALLAAVTGCDAPAEHGGPPDRAAGMGEKGPAGTAAEPQTLAGAKAAAVAVGKRSVAQDFGGSWDLFDATGKAAISRADYVAYATTCKLRGTPLEARDVRLDSPASAIVRYEVSGVGQALTLVYQGGHWRVQVTQEDLAIYRRGLEATIAGATSDERC